MAEFLVIDIDDAKQFIDDFRSGQVITQDVIDDTIEQASKEVIRSIEVGFKRGRSPDGAQWKENPGWWQAIKGHNKPNIGIPPTKPQLGVWEYQQNRKHMKDSLRFKVGVGDGGGMSRESIVDYETDVQKRAAEMQAGGRVMFKKKNRASGNEFTYMVSVYKREHMGLASWHRHPFSGKNDIEMVIDMFTDAVVDAIENYVDGVNV